MSEQAMANTDREIFREGGGDGNGMSYYKPTVSVALNEQIIMQSGGRAVQKSISEWVELAWPKDTPPTPATPLAERDEEREVSMYRKKPVVIEAHQFDGTSGDIRALRYWMGGGEYREPVISTRGRYPMEIATLEGIMIANPGDFIIRGVQGEFYPCKPDIFAETYEDAGEPTNELQANLDAANWAIDGYELDSAAASKAMTDAIPGGKDDYTVGVRYGLYRAIDILDDSRKAAR